MFSLKNWLYRTLAAIQRETCFLGIFHFSSYSERNGKKLSLFVEYLEFWTLFGDVHPWHRETLSLANIGGGAVGLYALAVGLFF